ncbi:MAG: hypothetical protein JXR48_07535 [Candidatus Delongbacteria bacterium]|nr:hypothetical protein [Candidatus Delongbacteria bacterium]MBN2834803.1 hypothetical protein [Candidatus Delongbacteria bacterium]
MIKSIVILLFFLNFLYCEPKLNMELLKTIDSVEELSPFDRLSIAFSDYDNFYFISNNKNSKIYIFDFNINLIQSFGGFGEGPSEFINLESIAILNDTLYCLHRYGRSLKKISISSKDLCSKDYPIQMSQSIFSTKDFLIQYWFDANYNKFDGHISYYSSGKDIYVRKGYLDELNKRRTAFNYQIIPEVDFQNNRVFYTDDRENLYRITCYDLSNEKIDYIIDKKYRKIPIKNHEFKKYFDAINSLYYTKNNILLINQMKKEDEINFIFDAYKNGNFIGVIETKLKYINKWNSSSKLLFINDKIFYYNSEEQELNVYNYEIIE